MKRKKTSCKAEVESLVKKCVIEEAFHKVLDQFSKALDNLESENRELLEAYFDGTPIDELSKRTKLSQDELKDWLAKAKRELTHNLRNGMQIKQ